jgi:hypothetical protein
MIDRETKNKLLQELEKFGNIYLSCVKIGINKATYYRWRKNDNAFRRLSDQAIRMGRENNCEIAEHALMLKVKEKDMNAIKYLLSHQSARYKPNEKSKPMSSNDINTVINKERARFYYDGYSEAYKKISEELRRSTENDIPKN